VVAGVPAVSGGVSVVVTYIIEVYNDSQSELIRSAKSAEAKAGFLIENDFSAESTSRGGKSISGWLQRRDAQVILMSMTFSVLCSLFPMPSTVNLNLLIPVE